MNENKVWVEECEKRKGEGGASNKTQPQENKQTESEQVIMNWLLGVL